MTSDLREYSISANTGSQLRKQGNATHKNLFFPRFRRILLCTLSRPVNRAHRVGVHQTGAAVSVVDVCITSFTPVLPRQMCDTGEFITIVDFRYMKCVGTLFHICGVVISMVARAIIGVSQLFLLKVCFLTTGVNVATQQCTVRLIMPIR